MSVTLEELKVVIDAEIKPLQNKMRQVEGAVRQSTSKIQSATNSVKNTLSGLGKLAVFGAMATALYQVGKYSTTMALEVNAAMNQISRTMGESTQQFLKWAENNALAFNMSKGEAIKYGAVYSNLFSSFIQDTDKLAAYTAKMLETSSIVASGTGRDITDVMERIRSGLLGNTEAIEDLGIMVNVSMIESTEAFKKFANGQSWQQLDFQTQQQIRLMAILEQATARYGETLKGSVNNRISKFKALLKDSALNLGNALLPVINAIMPVLNALAGALRYATAKLAEFVQLLFNKKVSSKDGVGAAIENTTKGLGGASDAAGDLADNLGDAGGGADDLAKGVGKAGKEAKKAAKELLGLMGFDEINLLNKKDSDSDSDSSSPGGSGGGGKGKDGKGSGGRDILPDLDITDRGEQYDTMFDGLLEKLKPLIEFLEHLKNLFSLGWKLTFREEGIDRIKNALNGIWDSIQSIFSDGTVATTAQTFMEKLAFALGQTAGAIANVMLGIGVFITESLDKSLKETAPHIKEWLKRTFLTMGEEVASLGNIFADISDIFYDTITSKPATDIGANIISTLTHATIGISDLGHKIGRDLFYGIETIIHDNKSKFVEAFQGYLKYIDPIIRTAKDMIKTFFESFNKMYDEHMKPFIDSFVSGVSKIVGVLLDGWNTYINPVLEKLGEKFYKMYQEHMKPAIESIFESVGKVVDCLKLLWETILQPLIEWISSNIMPVLAPIIDFLTSTIFNAVGLIADIIKGIWEILVGVIEFIVGTFTGDWDTAWNGVKDIFKGIWDIIVGIFDFVWEEIKTIFEPVVNWFSGKWSATVDVVKSIFEPIVKWFEGKWEAIKSIYNTVKDWFKEQFSTAWDNIKNIFTPINTWFSEKWNGVKSALSDVASWFGNIFTRAYQSVQNAFSSIGSFFSGIWQTVKGIFVDAGVSVGNAVGGAFRGAVNTVLSTIENIVNGFVNMINGVIGIINELPGVSIGYINGISLPRLAKGGIVDSATMAIIGEAGKEAVMPLENNTGWITDLASKVADRMPINYESNSMPSGDIVIQIGGQEFGRIAIKEINAEQERAGTTLLKI